MANIRTSVNVSEELLEKIDALATFSSRTRSKEVIRALQEYVDRHYSTSGEHFTPSPESHIRDLEHMAKDKIMENPQILIDLYNEIISMKKAQLMEMKVKDQE